MSAADPGIPKKKKRGAANRLFQSFREPYLKFENFGAVL
jgi:hypothetical protein